MKPSVLASVLAGLACAGMSVATASAATRPIDRNLARGLIRQNAVAAPISGKHRIDAHQMYSTNWSGYAAYNDTFSDAKGGWTQPSADCSGVKGNQQTVASFFVGLDGYNSSTVEQTGVDAICVGTTARYLAWYEFYPARPFVIGTVSAGDTLTAEVKVSGGMVTTTLTDPGASWSPYSASMSAAGLALNSAEWITEAPAHLLTKFDTVTFGSASATDSANHTGTITDSSWQNDEIILVNHNGPQYTFRATPDDLSGDGSSFDVDWNSFF